MIMHTNRKLISAFNRVRVEQNIVAIVAGTLLLFGMVLCTVNIALIQNHSVQESFSHVCLTPDLGECAGIAEHLTHWQAMSTAVLVNTLSFLLLLALVAVASLHRHRLALSLLSARLRLPSRRYPVFLPTLFQMLFSKGILHSKAF